MSSHTVGCDFRKGEGPNAFGPLTLICIPSKTKTKYSILQKNIFKLLVSPEFISEKLILL